MVSNQVVRRRGPVDLLGCPKHVQTEMQGMADGGLFGGTVILESYPWASKIRARQTYAEKFGTVLSREKNELLASRGGPCRTLSPSGPARDCGCMREWFVQPTSFIRGAGFVGGAGMRLQDTWRLHFALRIWSLFCMQGTYSRRTSRPSLRSRLRRPRGAKQIVPTVQYRQTHRSWPLLSG